MVYLDFNLPIRVPTEEFGDLGQLAHPLLFLLAQLDGSGGITLARPPMMFCQGKADGGG